MENKLAVIDGETLMDMRLPPTRFCVQTLLPQGVTVLGGAPKIGKSWLVLDLCIRIAKGESIWNLLTAKGTTLYLCLEDTARRIQERLLCITDEVPRNAFFAVAAKTLADGLVEQIRQFVSEHPDTGLVAIDTFQMVRGSETDVSYANDYQEIRQLKTLADELGISILLVHHLRKQGDVVVVDCAHSLPRKRESSTAPSLLLFLTNPLRWASSEENTTLICTGRDIEYRELELNFCKENCSWELIMGSAEAPELLLPKEMAALIAFTRGIGSFSGSNAELTEQFNASAGMDISSKGLKQMMNKWRYQLEDSGVRFRSYRSNGQRLVHISFSAVPSDSSDGNDASTGCAKSCVTCGPYVPDEECGGGDFSPSGESQHRICLDVGPCPPPAKSGFAGRCPTPGRTEETA